MDPIERNQSRFHKIDEEISLFIELFRHDRGGAVSQMDKLVKTSELIGGGLHRDILQLQKDFLAGSSNEVRVIQDALRIKHEIREL